MVTLSRNIVNKNIQEFVQAVEARYPIQGFYLFGSHVLGTADSESDIDLLVVSPDFAKNRFDAQVELLMIASEIDTRIEPHPMTPDEFELSNPLAAEVMRTGIAINTDVRLRA
ncbi:MAG TPA: nucleotidyltransferase domain-containing protein [Anaerolineales bacterium]|nr:nucleotidyltransferase domain-containing protein [Anaerolineales bacterium]